MKKYSIILFAVLFITAIGSSSCKSCKGGGWYGDRNLGYVPTKEKPAETVSPIITEEKEEASCDVSNP